MNDEQTMGGDEEDMPPEMKEHMLAAFAHKAGLGPHPGMYQGPPRKRSDDPTDTDMQRAAEEPLEDEGEARHEASYGKMRQAQAGGALAPSEMEQTASRQTGTMQQQQEMSGAAQAAQAQAAQPATAPPPAAPAGPVGTSKPYPVQRSETPPGIPESQEGQAPEAPGNEPT